MSLAKSPNNRITLRDIILLFKPLPFSERGMIMLLFAVGIFLSPITLCGVIWFYMRSYYRHMKPKGMQPVLWPLLPITGLSMAIGGVLIWVLMFAFVKFVLLPIMEGTGMYGFAVLGLYLLSFLWSAGIILLLMKWRSREVKAIRQQSAHGSAKLADWEDYADLCEKGGIYIGGLINAWARKGHILTFAGSQSGKFVNLIAHNLLGVFEYTGSWVMIDVKGQALAVTRKFQESTGRKVINLNPWGLFGKSVDSYNPLDLINIHDEESLVDDAAIIAQMLVPDLPNDTDPFWRNRARSWITGLIIYLMLSQEEKTLTTIWRWLRLEVKREEGLSQEGTFAELLSKMSACSNEVSQAVANEILSMIANEKAYSSVLSSAQDATDFLKSPALQRSLRNSSFNINELTKGSISLYVVIPADKLDAYAGWLRLVVTTSMLAVVRNKGKKVTFILDEFANLGKMDIVKTYMGLAAGYNMTLWPIFQDISQIKDVYGNGWENFMANAAVKHFFGISNDTTAKYVSQSIGTTTHVTEAAEEGKEDRTHARALMTPDEVKRKSADHIFLQVLQRNTLVMPKHPYYEDSRVKDLASPDPYHITD